MKAFDKIKETVEDPKFIQGVQTGAFIVGSTAILAIGVYSFGYLKGAGNACACIDKGFKAADPEAYAKLLEKTNALVKAGVIH